MRCTYGVDEAGRGPILGPMVIAVVALDRGGAISLGKRGICDSKAVSGPKAKERRRELAEVIQRRALGVAVRVIEVAEVDAYTFRGELNVLERKVVLELLRELRTPDDAKVICDGANMFAPLRKMFANLQAVNNGEGAHVSVAAASIVAKDARDQAFAQIAARYEADFGPITGGGYLNAGTRRFLEAYEARHGCLPPEARKSWGAPKIFEPQPTTLPLFEQS